MKIDRTHVKTKIVDQISNLKIDYFYKNLIDFFAKRQIDLINKK